jgi:hypothetical protein
MYIQFKTHYYRLSRTVIGDPVEVAPVHVLLVLVCFSSLGAASSPTASTSSVSSVSEAGLV